MLYKNTSQQKKEVFLVENKLYLGTLLHDVSLLETKIHSIAKCLSKLSTECVNISYTGCLLNHSTECY